MKKTCDNCWWYEKGYGCYLSLEWVEECPGWVENKLEAWLITTQDNKKGGVRKWDTIL